jgi:hypothetical protein
MSGLTVAYDDSEVRAYLAKFSKQRVDQLLKEATSKGGIATRNVMRPAAPVVSGDLKSSVRSRRIRSNPAIGQVVGPMGRTGSHRWLVEHGTKPHRIPKASRVMVSPLGWFEGGAQKYHAWYVVHGSRPHPWVGAVADSALDAGVNVTRRLIEEHVRT